jgi:hypothetical protein
MREVPSRGPSFAPPPQALQAERQELAARALASPTDLDLQEAVASGLERVNATYLASVVSSELKRRRPRGAGARAAHRAVHLPPVWEHSQQGLLGPPSWSSKPGLLLCPRSTALVVGMLALLRPEQVAESWIGSW